VYVSVKLAEEKCNGCRMCVFTCPDPNVFTFYKERKKVTVNEKRCKGCGLCVVACPKEALNVSAG
jgi:Pyruvate/2-oxoacid:ferredoxin oxidoreductase delta subunit